MTSRRAPSSASRATPMSARPRRASAILINDRTGSVLAALWRAAEHPEAALDAIELSGAEPVLPSSFAIGTAAQATIAAAALAAAELWRLRTGRQQRIGVDMRSAAIEFRSERYLRIDGAPHPEYHDPIATVGQLAHNSQTSYLAPIGKPLACRRAALKRKCAEFFVLNDWQHWCRRQAQSQSIRQINPRHAPFEGGVNGFVASISEGTP
jgi:hypothetical protein